MGTLNLCDFCYIRCKKTTKITWDGLQPSSNMLNVSLRWAGFPIKIGLNAQWKHLFSMYLLVFWSFTLFFSLKVHFSMRKWSLSGNTIYLRLLAMKGFDAIRPEYDCFISMIISADTLYGFAPYVFDCASPSQKVRFYTVVENILMAGGYQSFPNQASLLIVMS